MLTSLLTATVCASLISCKHFIILYDALIYAFFHYALLSFMRFVCKKQRTVWFLTNVKVEFFFQPVQLTKREKSY